ncbi:MAG: helix-hairpin-helix domain-containing protein [Armatimonadetes bacterium]|nr:helix-hairpin-helix domain-containing protein [Armatimonadota bacterium]
MLFFSRVERIILATCLAVLAACGLVWLTRNSPVFPSHSRDRFFTESPFPEKEIPESVIVHVAGRVRNPGVYELPLTSRVKDALRAAGGHVGKADLDSLNLAKVLEDGEKVYVPDLSERGLATSFAGAPRPGTSSAATKKAQGLSPRSIDLNRSGVAELEKLPGVGPSTAERIVQFRKQNGRFSSVEDLMKVRGIGPKKFEQMKSFVRV